jgi:outer membrane protein OmpA-like peptidoglycan-associated protein
MSTKPHSPSKHRRRKGRGQNDSFAPSSGVGIGKGTPRYLNQPKASSADHSSASEKEARQIGASDGRIREKPIETPLGLEGAQAVRASGSKGQKLSERERGATEQKLGADFSDVTVHYDSAIATQMGANAVTFDNNVHFAKGADAAGLMGHELAHVQQQRQFGSSAAQFDLAINDSDTGDTGMGIFDLNFATATTSTGGVGLQGYAEFHPYAESPLSNRIGLIQTADTERLGVAGEPDFDWSGSSESNREHVKNADGSFVDMLHANLSPDRNEEPWYWQGFSSDPETSARDHFGWNRSEDDIGSTRLGDFPSHTRPLRFAFETAAKGRDNDVIYGVVRWGFDTDGSTTTSNEWLEVPKITASNGPPIQSSGFDEALGEFRDFYVHEPEIIYFDYNESVPTDAELSKLSDVASYMSQYPDVQIDLSATSDMQGGGNNASNRRLAIERMNSVHGHLLNLGVDPSRIIRNEAIAAASNAQGSQDAAHQNTEGSYRVNRRVTVRFQNTASRAP